MHTTILQIQLPWKRLQINWYGLIRNRNKTVDKLASFSHLIIIIIKLASFGLIFWWWVCMDWRSICYFHQKKKKIHLLRGILKERKNVGIISNERFFFIFFKEHNFSQKKKKNSMANSENKFSKIKFCYTTPRQISNFLFFV